MLNTIVAMINGGGAAAASNYLASITTSAGEQSGRAMVLYGGDLYVAGYDAQGGGLFQKITTSGTVSVSKYLSNAFSLGVGNLANDGAGNFYLANTSGAQSALVVKINSSGAIQAQKEYGGLYSTMGVLWDSTNSVGYWPIYPATGGKGMLVKVDSTLAITWQKAFSTTGGAADDQYLYAIALDSSQTPHVFGYARGGTEGLVMKMTTAGAITWQVNGQGPLPVAGVVDSSGNVYALGFSGPTLWKYNSSGTQQWVRRCTSGLGLFRSAENSLILAADGYLYYIGYYQTGGTAGEGGFIIKYNTSGVIQWQRTLKSAADNIRLQAIVVDGTTMYVTGKIATNGGDVFLAALPTDGSLTGTYSLGGTNIVYAAGGFTEADPGYTSVTQTVTSANSSLSATTPTYTSTTSTATVTKVAV